MQVRALTRLSFSRAGYYTCHTLEPVESEEDVIQKNVIVDFDNTLGVRGCDVDDGLALLGLLGTEGVQVEAVCTCYGNSDIETVTHNTQRMFAEMGIDLPVYRGCSGPDELQSDASRFLAKAAADRPGELSLLATGSMTNLLGASLVDPFFFGNLREIVCMGGISQSLVITPGHIMDELNFSCDANATLAMLSSPCPVTIATAQNCMPASFQREGLVREFSDDSWLCRTVDYWFHDMDAAYDWEGWICWDLVAAFALCRPHLFEWPTMDITLNKRFIQAGYLERAVEDAPSATVSTPVIIEADAFRAEAYEAWHAALAKLGVA